MEEQIAPDMVFVALTHEQVFCFSLSDIIHQCHIREMEESTETSHRTQDVSGNLD